METFIENQKSRNFPRIPVIQVLTEAMSLSRQCWRDKALLINAGLDSKDIDEFPELITKCSESEAKWIVYNSLQSIKTKRLSKLEKTCRELRLYITKKLQQTNRLSKIKYINFPEYKKGCSRAELVQHINDLVVICNNRRKLLVTIHFDFDKLKQAAGYSEELFVGEAKKLVESRINPPEKVERDTAYIQLTEMMSNVRKIARVAFKKDRRNLKNYTRQYFLKYN